VLTNTLALHHAQHQSRPILLNTEALARTLALFQRTSMPQAAALFVQDDKRKQVA